MTKYVSPLQYLKGGKAVHGDIRVVCVGKVVQALLPGSSLLSKVPQDGLNVPLPAVARPQTEELGHEALQSHEGVLVGGLVGTGREKPGVRKFVVMGHST